MKILLRQVHITDPSSPFNGNIADILIDKGIIVSIAENIDSPAAQLIEQKGLHASPGWMDIFSHFCDPGFEYKETIESGTRAAAAGGYTSVAVLPNTNPVVQSKSQIEYILSKSRQAPVNLYPLGAISKNTEGKDLAEMYDMRAAGALAFSDGLNAVQSAGLMLKALQYIKAFDGVILQVPDDTSINPHGLMNEGIISTQLGLPGKPAMAEEIMVARDIKLARYCSSRIHFAGVSSAKSLEYIQRAKEAGIKITCSVTPYHLFFCDEDLQDYNTNLKVNLPLRTQKDREALKLALQKGVIDTIASFHIPQNWDSKVCEFEYAKPGMIGLESCYSVVNSSTDLSAAEWVQKVAINSRTLLGLDTPQLKEGAKAEISLFNPSTHYTFAEEQISSVSKNSAFIGKQLKGKVVGIINNNQLFLNK
jgi:dihydroorotase